MKPFPEPSTRHVAASTNERSASSAPGLPVLLASTAAIAATYVYFLIFAEFAFLEFAAASLTPAQMEPLMGALGTGGIAGSLFAAARFSLARSRLHLALGFAASLATALFTLNAHTVATLLPAAAGIGLSLGWGTVTLALSLRSALSLSRLAPVCGAGTGLAYALCNQPTIFSAAPADQITAAATAAAVGLVAVFWLRPQAPAARTPSPTDGPAQSLPALKPARAARWIAVFFVLVFLDSLAFYLIQHNPAVKSQTWSSDLALHGNAFVHLATAILTGFLLRHFRVATIVFAALLLLVAACALLNSPSPHYLLARSLYIAGVSAYSTALVFLPARQGSPWFTALFMAISGWIGSAAALGLALQQTSAHVPGWTLLIALVAGLLVLGRTPFLAKPLRPPALTALLLTLAGVFVSSAQPLHAADSDDPLIAAGRRVYISEGCIHCHSQYVRPGTDDVLRWGPAHTLADVLTAQPPLLGNRRQGPDLANVGNRRTPEWNRLHLETPRVVSPGSRMPSYAHLFREGDSRGEALLAYLASLGADTLSARLVMQNTWQPVAASTPLARPAQQKLFQQLCTACHGSDGHADGPLASHLGLRPPDFHTASWRRFPAAPDDTTLARVIKFGFPGSSMAGHEYLSDTEIVSLVAYVKHLHAVPLAP
jgi:mono/diheme cytochrome c family protein